MLRRGEGEGRLRQVNIYAKYQNSGGILNLKHSLIHIHIPIHIPDMTIWSNKFPVGLPFRWFISLYFTHWLEPAILRMEIDRVRSSACVILKTA